MIDRKRERKKEREREDYKKKMSSKHNKHNSTQQLLQYDSACFIGINGHPDKVLWK